MQYFSYGTITYLDLYLLIPSKNWNKIISNMVIVLLFAYLCSENGGRFTKGLNMCA